MVPDGSVSLRSGVWAIMHVSLWDCNKLCETLSISFLVSMFLEQEIITKYK